MPQRQEATLVHILDMIRDHARVAISAYWRASLRGEVLSASQFPYTAAPLLRLLGLFVSSTPNVTLLPCLRRSSLGSPPSKLITASSSWLSSPRTDISGTVFSVPGCAARVCVARRVLLLGLGRLGDGWNSDPFVAANSISIILQRRTSKGMGLKRWVCKFIQENSNDEKNPPLFQLHVIWYVGLGLAIKIERDLQIAPTCNVNHDTLRAICATLFRMCPC